MQELWADPIENRTTKMEADKQKEKNPREAIAKAFLNRDVRCFGSSWVDIWGEELEPSHAEGCKSVLAL